MSESFENLFPFEKDLMFRVTNEDLKELIQVINFYQIENNKNKLKHLSTYTMSFWNQTIQSNGLFYDEVSKIIQESLLLDRLLAKITHQFPDLLEIKKEDDIDDE